MTQQHTTHLRSLYRRLLRELPSTPQATRTRHQKLSSPSPLQRRIRNALSGAQETSSLAQTSSSSTQASRSPPPTSSVPRQLAHAEQFIAYVQAQRSHTALLERYNPGIGMTEAERVRLSARRVGMNLPVEFEEGEGAAEVEGVKG